MENAVALKNSTEITKLDMLAQEAHFYARSAYSNLLQLGRIFVEAKAIIGHGNWQKWIKDNAGCSIKTAQNFMAVYRKSCECPAISTINEPSKAFALLALPAGSLDDFMEENDIEQMSVRQLKDRIAEVKAAQNTDAAENDNIKQMAHPDEELVNRLHDTEKQLEEANGRLTNLTEDLYKLRTAQNDSESKKIIDDLNRKIIEQDAALREKESNLTEACEEIESLNRELDDYDDRLKTANRKITEFESAQARGDVDRQISTGLNADDFEAAVRQFVGRVMTMPNMGREFAAMDAQEHRRFERSIATLKNWIDGAENALGMIEGGIV